MIPKIIHLDEYFPTGEATVQPVLLWANNKACYENITKHASVGTEFFKTIQPIPGHSFVYVLAVSDWEHYGENRNGDGFPNAPFKPLENPPWISQAETLSNWHHTFEQFGNSYRHHVNKDPEKRVGRVVKSFWNNAMHRVELLIDLENDKAPDLAERIQNGEFPPVSMGTKVAWDVCTICGNRAPTRAQYCDHLRFQMRDVIDGVKVAALNPSPKFFDISWVVRPADPTAYMMKKVAYDQPYVISGAAAGEYLEEMQERKLAAHKLAVIDKVIQGIPLDAKSEGIDPIELGNVTKMRDEAMRMGKRMPTMNDSTLQELSTHPLRNVVTTTLSSGMLMNTPEVTKIIIYKSHPGIGQVPDDLVDRITALRGSIMRLFEDMPQLLDSIDQSGVFDIAPSHVDPKVAEIIMPYLEKRSGIMEYLKRKVVPTQYREEYDQTTPLTITDPVSGQQYATTRRAAIASHDDVAKRNLYKVVGGGALLGGAYKMMASGLRSKGLGNLRPLVGATLAGVGLSQWPTMGRHYMTDQGIPIPITTELTTKTGSASLALPLFGTLGLMGLAAHDYHSRMNRGEPEVDPYDSAPTRAVQGLESVAVNHPLLTAVGGTLGLRAFGQTPAAQYLATNVIRPLAQHGRMNRERIKATVGDWAKGTDEKFRQWAANSEKMSMDISAELQLQPTDTVLLPCVDFNKVAELIGMVLVG